MGAPMSDEIIDVLTASHAIGDSTLSETQLKARGALLGLYFVLSEKQARGCSELVLAALEELQSQATKDAERIAELEGQLESVRIKATDVMKAHSLMPKYPVHGNTAMGGVTALDSALHFLEAKITRLESRGIEDMKHTIADLEAQLAEARTTYGDMKQCYDKLKIDYDKLKIDYAEVREGGVLWMDRAWFLLMAFWGDRELEIVHNPDTAKSTLLVDNFDNNGSVPYEFDTDCEGDTDLLRVLDAARNAEPAEGE